MVALLESQEHHIHTHASNMNDYQSMRHHIEGIDLPKYIIFLSTIDSFL